MGRMNHLNMNAVGLIIDITNGLMKHRKNNAAIVKEGELIQLTKPLIIQFVNDVSTLLDEKYGVK